MSAKRYWLFKSEPQVWGWAHQAARGAPGQEWDGVRNYQARNNMRAMAPGDLGFFYHSNTDRAVVGVIEICGLAHHDSTTEDARWDCVDVRAVAPFPRPVTLDACKAEPRLAAMALVTNSRLSVQPVTAEEWAVVCEMGGYSG